MGKWGNSEIHAWWSDWHWAKCGRGSILTDADVSIGTQGQMQQRLWMWPPRDSWPPNGKPIGVADLKVVGSLDKEPSPTARWSYNWYEENDVPYYIIKINMSIPFFTVTRVKTGITKQFNEEQMISWVKGGLIAF